MAQVSGSKITVIQPSKNMGTVIDTQVSGEKVNATLAYRKITEVQKTQVDGQVKMTNYMGINDEGADIFHAKKVDETFGAVDQYTAQGDILEAADAVLEAQELDKKKKNWPAEPAQVAEDIEDEEPDAEE